MSVALETLTRHQLQALVRKLRRELGELQAEIARLTAESNERQKETERARAEAAELRKKVGAAPFSKGQKEEKPRRKSGRKPGEGVFKHREAPPVSPDDPPPVDVPLPPNCRCGGHIVFDRFEEVTNTDLPERPRPVTRRYQVGLGHCDRCGERTRGWHPDVAPDQHGATAHRLGPRAIATGLVLHVRGIPVRKVPAVLADLTGLSVTQGALTQEALRVAETRAIPVYERLRREVAAGPVLHTDDTGWRVDGEPAQMMVFANDTTSVYQVRSQHRNQEVREVVTPDFHGTMVTDRGRAYDARELEGVPQQKCMSHAQRSLSEVLETKTGRGRSFALSLKALLKKGVLLWHDLHEGRCTRSQFDKRATLITAQVTAQLLDREIKDPDNQRLLNELGRHHDRGNLLRFLADPEVPPTNNLAERELRPAVIRRKVSQCSKNWRGAHAHASIVSIVRTAIRRAPSAVIDTVRELLWPTGQPMPSP